MNGVVGPTGGISVNCDCFHNFENGINISCSNCQQVVFTIKALIRSDLVSLFQILQESFAQNGRWGVGPLLNLHSCNVGKNA